MSSIPLMVAPPPPIQGPLQQAQSATGLQALINQTRMQQQEMALAPIRQQEAQQQLQQQQIATQEQQQAFDDTQKFNQAFRDANGDWDQTIQKATEAGASGTFITKAQIARAGQVAQMAKAGSDVLDNQQKQLDLVGQGAIRLKGISDPSERLAAQHQLFNELVTAGVNPSHLQDLNGGSLTDAQLDQHINESKAAQGMVKDAQAIQKSATEHPAEVAAAQQKAIQSYATGFANTKSDAEWQALRQSLPDELKTQFADHWSPENAQAAADKSITPEERLKAQNAIPLDKQEAQAWLAANPGKTLADFMRYKATLVPAYNFNLATGGGINTPAAPGTPGGQGGPSLTPAQTQGQRVGLTPAALDQSAQNYLQTGQVPSVRGGGPAAALQQKAIFNRAAELDPNGNIAANKDVQKSYAGSLDAVQKNLSTVSAFENTAIKNLDNMLDKARAIPELGTRFANVPVRMISEQMLGTPQMAAFRAAQQTASAEAAKVLGSANATGVLSDTQKREAEDILNGNLPYPAMEAAINTLKQDFANRHQSYQDQVNDLQGKLRRTPTQQGNTPATQQQNNPTGQQFKVPAGAPPAPKEDGHKLKQNGQLIAVSKGGQWVAPASQ